MGNRNGAGNTQNSEAALAPLLTRLQTESKDGGTTDEPQSEAFASSPIISSSLGNNSSCGRVSHLSLRTNISWKQLCCLSPSCLVAEVKHKIQEESSPESESLILKRI